MRIATIGLDRATANALRADYPGAAVVALPPAPPGRLPKRAGPCPDVVVIGPHVASVVLERTGARLGWSEGPVIVAVHRDTPLADIWCGPTRHERVELAPGFLDPFLPGLADGWSGA